MTRRPMGRPSPGTSRAPLVRSPGGRRSFTCCILVGTAGYATGLFTSGVEVAMGRQVTAGTVAWNVIGGVTGGIIGGPATASMLNSVARRLLTSVLSIGKGIAASRAGSRVLGK